MAKKTFNDYPEIGAILARLKGGRPHEVVILFVPSHDRNQKELTDRDIWANQALELFGKLFTGATAFQNLSGIYQPKRDLRPLYDQPIMIQTLTATENVENEENLLELAEFCRNMGRKTNQAGIGLVVNNFFIDIQIAPE
jgi:hypothetical protein